MLKTPKNAFSSGYKQRQHYPLHSGLYKLRESRQNLKRMHTTVTEVQLHKQNNRRLPYALNQCMRFEVSSWLKSTPSEITWLLGYNILPAIYALTGDRINAIDIQSIRKNIQPEIEKLIIECERTNHLIKKNIKYEYRNMKCSQSELLDLLEHGIHICDSVITSAQTILAQNFRKES